jgi:anti-sigma regulatory factor (Ser/Thr protein kinase)
VVICPPAALHEQLAARPQSIGRLRRAVVEFAGSRGASSGQCATIALAVSEALSNAVLHAYLGHEQPGDVVVVAQMHEAALEVVVCDEGSGMRPRSDSPGAGLGLPLIARLTEQLEIRDTTPGMCVRMTFAIG